MVFHPETIEKAKKNNRFQDFLVNIAIEQVQQTHKITFNKGTCLLLGTNCNTKLFLQITKF